MQDEPADPKEAAVCLGIPGRIVSFHDDNDLLATADIAGVQRAVNVGLVLEDGLQVGDHVLIHVGFAMSIIDEAEAEAALSSLKMLGGDYEDEMAALRESRIT